MLICRAFDTDDEGQQYKVGGRNYIGESIFTIGDIIGSSDNEVETPLKNEKGEEVRKPCTSSCLNWQRC